MTTIAREGFAHQAFERDLAAKRESHLVICVDKLRVPDGAELLECYRIGDRIIVMGEPNPTEDETSPSYHNCDAMGCGCLGHVIARITLP